MYCSCVSICMCIRSLWSSNTLQMGGCGFLELEIFSTALDAIAVQQIILEKQDMITPPTHKNNSKIWTLTLLWHVFLLACSHTNKPHQKTSTYNTNTRSYSIHTLLAQGTANCWLFCCPSIYIYKSLCMSSIRFKVSKHSSTQTCSDYISN